MNANKALWEKGDFTKVAESMRESGEALVKSLSTLVQGKRVMDLGCGDGTTALPMAQIASQVVGVDIATNLVAAGNARLFGKEENALHCRCFARLSLLLTLVTSEQRVQGCIT